jgi:hypothetical protein
MDTATRSRTGLPPLGLRLWAALVLVNALLVVGMLTIWHEVSYGLAIWLVWVALTLYMLTMAVWEIVLLARRRSA